jgi:hypothetical protein
MKNRISGRRVGVSGIAFNYKNGKLHCIDGPSVTCPSGAKEWHFHGRRIMHQSLLRDVMLA